MSYQRKFAMWFRFSVVSALAIASFWGVWALFVGPVPVVTDIVLPWNKAASLPFGISRWADVLMGPLYAALFVSINTSEHVRTFAYLPNWLDGLVLGLGIGLNFGLIAGLIYGLVCGVVAGLVFGLVCALVCGLTLGLGFGLIDWLDDKPTPGKILSRFGAWLVAKDKNT